MLISRVIHDFADARRFEVQPQGLKPIPFWAIYGTARAVPLQNISLFCRL
jgi:hypothetical protein